MNDEEDVMTLRINSEAPNFTAETTEGKINFHQWIGDKWANSVLYPKDSPQFARLSSATWPG